MSFPIRRTSLSLFLLTLLVAVGGCQNRGLDFDPYVTRLYLEESSNMPTSRVIDLVLPVSGTPVTVSSSAAFFEGDILRATYFETEFGRAIVLLLTPEATTDLYRTTISNQGRRLVALINGLPIGAHYIARPIQDGRIAFFLELDDDEVPEIVDGIQKTSNEIQRRANKSSRW